MEHILLQIKEAVWGTPTVLVILLFGIYFSAKTGFLQLTGIRGIIRDTICSLTKKSDDGISPFAAVATALGGTVGVGSILGVGYGISVGGAGSIFWMWVCSFFGMGLKYAEVSVALSSRVNIGGELYGGAPFRLKQAGFGKLSAVFCVLCVMSSFGTGNLTQTGAVARVLSDAGLDTTSGGLICAAMLAIAVFGGKKRIASINTFLVPAASAVYLCAAVVILWINASNLPEAFASIFRSAFGITPLAGGLSGALISASVREGFARSVFSNEAGMGSSPLAHATAGNTSPHIQGEWGIFEIFFDSFVVSTITALCLLCCGTTDCNTAFADSFGLFGNALLGLLTAVFAFASVISWCYYAECCLVCLRAAKWVHKVYRVFSVAAAFFGAVVSAGFIWEISDILNALMLVPNLILLFIRRDEIKRKK